MTTPDTLVGALKEAGLRLTPQRLAICDIIAASRDHPTAQDVHTRLKEKYPTSSLTTVYITLDTLVRLGVIHALGTAGDETVHYDSDTVPHINLACISCHRIVDLASNHIEALDSEVRERTGPEHILGSRIVYYSECLNAVDKYECPFWHECYGCENEKGCRDAGKREAQ